MHKKTTRKRNMNLWEEFDPDLSEGKYQIPLIRKENYIPPGLVDFSQAIRSRDFSKGVHFYLDDSRFECVWKEPYRYIPILKRFACVFTPDFSLYTDMPMAMKIWNLYRARLIGQMMQRAGIAVIPTISWAGPETYEFCFDGLPKNGTVTVSTVGIMRSRPARELFKSGLSAMLAAVRPKRILMYGTLPDFDFGKVAVFHFENTSYNWKITKKDVNCKETL